jgi:hypothetical protein
MAPPEEAPDIKDPCRSMSFHSKVYNSVYPLSDANFEPKYLPIEFLLQLVPF